MLTQVGPHEYEVTHIVLDESQSLRLDQLMQEPDETASRCVDEAAKRALERVSERPLQDLLST